MMTAPHSPGRLKRLRERAKRNFITGLLVIVPLWLTWVVLAAIVRRIDGVLAILPEAYRPEELLGFPIPGLGVILTLIVIQVVGFLGSNLWFPFTSRRRRDPLAGVRSGWSNWEPARPRRASNALPCWLSPGWKATISSAA